jgi:hypothetical protein
MDSLRDWGKTPFIILYPSHAHGGGAGGEGGADNQIYFVQSYGEGAKE